MSHTGERVREEDRGISSVPVRCVPVVAFFIHGL